MTDKKDGIIIKYRFAETKDKFIHIAGKQNNENIEQILKDPPPPGAIELRKFQCNDETFGLSQTLYKAINGKWVKY